jgi:predicted phage terminase large subunit-like protein
VVYEKAIREDGSLLFPKRLSKKFLDEQRRALGPYIFANQYMNEIIPAEDQDFKASWIKYYDTLPDLYYTFAFLDPAISTQDTADFTALVVVHVDVDGNWYISQAKRYRINATDTIQLLFDVAAQYQPMCIGVEIVAYQKAIMHFLDKEMRHRGAIVPVKGIQRGADKTKEKRILSLVPRFEWGRIYLNKGLTDLEDEYSKFPRSSYDDILDALSSIEEICFSPERKKEDDREPAPNSPRYEQWYIRNQNRSQTSWETSEDDY